MKTFAIAFLTLLAVNLSAQTTDLQYQAHVPTGVSNEIKFSAYLADSSFNDNSHLNTSAFWYVEEKSVNVNNGMINFLLENIADSIFTRNQGNIFVYAYVNGVSLGKLALHKVPYAVSSRFSSRAELATNAINAEKAGLARRAGVADTSVLSLRSLVSNVADSSVKSARSVRSLIADSSVNSKHSMHSAFADTSDVALLAIYAKVAGYSASAAKADIADTAFYALNSGHSYRSDSAIYATNARHSVYADTALYSNNAGHSANSDIASNLQDSVVLARHIKNGSVNLLAIEGAENAAVGTVLTRGINGFSWQMNPHHKTSNVTIVLSAPGSISNATRYFVSRVAVDYRLNTVWSPQNQQLITIQNGATANTLTLDKTTWNLDPSFDIIIPAGQSRTLWYNGLNWIVVQ